MNELFSHQPHDLVAIGAAGERTAANLLEDARRVAAGLERHPTGEVLLISSDRYLFTVGLIGSWISGRAVLVPPNAQPATIAALASSSGVGTFLHDREGAAEGIHLRTLIAGPRSAAEATLPSLDFLAVTITTSGSTGPYERCPKRLGQLLGEAAVLADLFAIGRDMRVLASVPPHHIYGLLFGVLLPLRAGGAFVRESPMHAESVVAALRGLRITHFVSVPAHLASLAAVEDLPAVHAAFSSGAPLPGAVAEALRARHGWSVAEVFGSTETGGIAWRNETGAPWRTLPGVSATAGEDGRLLLESPFLAPGSTRPLPCADRIGPLPDGRFELLGRLDGIVKVAGKRVSLREIEERLLALPGVQDAAALSAPSPGTRGTEVWAAVVAPGWTQARLRRALAKVLDPVTVPRRFRLVAALPREATGKLVRSRLRQLFDEPGGAHVLQLEPDTERRTAGAVGDDVRELELTVSPDLLYFRGHFDGRQVLPGVVQLEGLVIRQARRLWPEVGQLQRILRLKFRRLIPPGARLTLRLVRQAGPRVAFEILGAEGPCTSGTLLFSPVDRLP